MMEFNDIFEYIGDIGLYQILLFTMVSIQAIISGSQGTIVNFVSAHMDHWCKIPSLENFPHDVQKYVAIPYDADDPEQYDSCSFYDLNYANMTNEDIWNWDRNSTENVTTSSCDAWVFDQSEFISTINSQYNLVCDRSWMSAFVSTAYMFGMMVGSLLGGFTSDRFGRFKPWIVGVFCNFSFGIAQAFSPNYTTFVIMRFLMSVADYISYLSAYILLAEFIGVKYRTNVGIAVTASGSLGIMLLSGYGYAVRDHQKLFILVGMQVVAMMPFIWVVPESPRWLLAKGNSKKSEKTLKFVAAVNGKHFPDDVVWDTHETTNDGKSEVKITLADVCKSTILCRELGLMCLNWFTTALVYYGLTLNAAAFGDVFMNNFLGGLVEVPAYLLCMLCMTKGNKRLSNSFSLLVGGAFCLACVPVLLTNESLEGVLTALSTLGKGAISFSFGCIYVYSADLFPTPARHAAFGTASIFARIGSMTSPYMGPPMEEIWRPMPTLIFGCLALFTGCMVLMLPETKGHNLPDTIADAEFIGRFKKGKKRGNTIVAEEGRKENIYQDSEKPFSNLELDRKGEKSAYENLAYTEDVLTYRVTKKGEEAFTETDESIRM